MRYSVNVNGKMYEVEVMRKDGMMQQPTMQPMMQQPAMQPMMQQSAVQPMMQQTPVAPAASAVNVSVECPMPGTVLAIRASVGQQVAAGECLIVIEAMKMENEIVAPQAGVVKQILVNKGASVDTGDVLAVIA